MYQGSCLGPLLFMQFINDLPDNLPQDCKRKLYADDLKIYRSVNTTGDAASFQRRIYSATSWSQRNSLGIHAKKTERIRLGSKPVEFVYQVDGVPVQPSEEVRDLGVIIDQKMVFKQHINKIVSLSEHLLTPLYQSASER